PRPVVICSKAKLPLSVWPATTRLTSSPDTLRNGPATRSRTVVFAPILNVWLIAALVVLNSSEKLPRSETPLLAARPTWALRRPARQPVGRRRGGVHAQRDRSAQGNTGDVEDDVAAELARRARARDDEAAAAACQRQHRRAVATQPG